MHKRILETFREEKKKKKKKRQLEMVPAYLN